MTCESLSVSVVIRGQGSYLDWRKRGKSETLKAGNQQTHLCGDFLQNLLFGLGAVLGLFRFFCVETILCFGYMVNCEF